MISPYFTWLPLNSELASPLLMRVVSPKLMSVAFPKLFNISGFHFAMWLSVITLLLSNFCINKITNMRPVISIVFFQTELIVQHFDDLSKTHEHHRYYSTIVVICNIRIYKQILSSPQSLTESKITTFNNHSLINQLCPSLKCRLPHDLVTKLVCACPTGGLANTCC